ncbi:MAG: type II secretion system protein GspM [Myxococcaceae bacterium]
MNQLRNLLANVQTWFSRLTARERRLVLITGGAVGVFVVFLILFSFSSSAARTQKSIASKLEQLEQVQQLAAVFRESENARQAVERQLGQSNVSLITYIEEKGTEAGLDIRTMNSKGDSAIGDGKIIETAVEVTLTDVPLDKLVSFLSAVERGPGVVKVKRLRLEPRPEQETITAWTTISTYSLKQ